MTVKLPEFGNPQLAVTAGDGRINDGVLDEIMRMTAAIFPVPIAVEPASDPDDPDVTLAIIQVRIGGSFDELLQKEMQWNDAVASIIPSGNSQVRLVIIPE